MQRLGPGSVVGCPTAWKTLQVPVCPGRGRGTHRGGRGGAMPGICWSWDCRAEDWVMGKQTLVREVWVFGQILRNLPLHPILLTGGIQQLLLEPLLKFHYMLKKLQLHKEEYVLMQAISLFSPGDDPTCPVWPPHHPQACSRRLSFSFRRQQSLLCPPGKVPTDSLAPRLTA